MPDTLYNDFETDAHRRVLGNLSQPRSVVDLIRFLDHHDSANSPGKQRWAEVGVPDILEDLEAAGLVKRLGAFDDPKALVATAKDDDQVPTLHKDKAANLVERLEHPAQPPFLETGEQWYWTERGLAKLQASIADEPPPLKGDALRAAKDANRLLAEQDEQLRQNGGKG